MIADWRVARAVDGFERRLSGIEERLGHADEGAQALDALRVYVDETAAELRAELRTGLQAERGPDGAEEPADVGDGQAAQRIITWSLRNDYLLTLQNSILKARVELAAGNRGRAADELALAERVVASVVEQHGRLGTEAEPTVIKTLTGAVAAVRQAVQSDDPTALNRLELLGYELFKALSTGAGVGATTGSATGATAGSAAP